MSTIHRAQYVWTDLVLFKESCNLRCLYCKGSPSRRNRKQSPSAPRQQQVARAIATLEKLNTLVYTPILKISGGEIFIDKENLFPLFSYGLQHYSILQILTNAVHLDPVYLDFFAENPHVHFQISLDSHVFEGNALRAPNAATHARILNNLRHVIQRKIPVEINCVLTTHSAPYLLDFAEFLNNIRICGVPLTLFPRPVRGESIRLFGSGEDGCAAVQSCLDRYEELAETLPPREYLIRVQNIIRSGRSYQCHIPFLVIGIEWDGKIRACTVGKMPDVGYVDELCVQQALLGRHHYNPNEKYVPCQECTNQYEIINLFLDARITLEDMHSMAIYKNLEVRNVLQSYVNDAKPQER